MSDYTPNPGAPNTAEDWAQSIAAVVGAAMRDGYVVTVETAPKQPFAIGSYDQTINVRPSRALYTLGALSSRSNP